MKSRFLADFFKREWFFIIIASLFLILAIITKPTLKELYNSVNWPTIRALTGLLLITTVFKLSNVFDAFAEFSIKKIKNEKTLSIIFVLLAVFMSMFLTNDITLFVLVPLTLAFNQKIKNDLTKLIIFEAIAVNVGSELTPIGNPQNLFIFRLMHIGFLEFIKNLSLIFIPQFILLIIFTYLMFPAKKLEIDISKKSTPNYPIFFISTLIFILFLISLELNLVRYFLISIVIFYLIIYNKVFFKFDYLLIITFILMFIDFSLITKIDFIKNIFLSFKMNFFNTFNISIVLSQIISNVPATIFMSHFSNDYLAIAYGANIGGNGLLIGSLANIIALRFLHNPKSYIIFHKYSVPYFVVSYILIIIIFGFFSVPHIF
jgi:Na+/H+ antiporter NhaD/arsenite permease-like protein